MMKVSLIVALLGLLFIPSPAWTSSPLCLSRSVFSPAALQVRRDTVYLISDVMVTANRKHGSITPVQTLNGKTLERLSVHSVADALRYFSGVQLKDYGGIGGLKTVNVRSMGSQHVGVFYDGVELDNAQNGVVDLGRFSLDNMESLSLYNGQKSSLLQPAKDYASASSVYMQTRVPRFARGENDNLRVGIQMGSFDTYNPSLLWEHRASSQLSSSLSAEMLYTSGRYRFRYAKKNAYDTTEVRHNGDVHACRAEGALFGKTDGWEWKGKVYLYTSSRGYPGASVREEPGRFTHQDRQWDTEVFVQGSAHKDFSTLYHLLVSAKGAYDFLHYRSDPRLDVTTMYVDNTYRQQEVYMSVAHLFNFSRYWSASLSSDLQWNKLNADLTGFVYPRRMMGWISAASSCQIDGLKMQGSLLYTGVVNHAQYRGSAAADKQQLTPSVILSWAPSFLEGLDFHAYYKRIFRLPTLNDLYYTFIGNKDLLPEYTTQYDAGFTWTRHFSECLKQMEIHMDAYYNTVENKIIAMPTSNQFRWTMVNLGFVQIHGIEAMAKSQWSMGPMDVMLSLTYTYQRAQDKTDRTQTYYGDQIPYIPRHSLTAIAALDYHKWTLDYSFVYTGKRYEASANIPENRAQPWYTSDLSVSRILPFHHSSLRITAEVNNLFNQSYEVVRCYPMPGTNVKLKIIFQL